MPQNWQAPPPLLIWTETIKNSSFSSGDRPLLANFVKWSVCGSKEEESERIKVGEAAFAPVKSIFSCRKEFFFENHFWIYMFLKKTQKMSEHWAGIAIFRKLLWRWIKTFIHLIMKFVWHHTCLNFVRTRHVLFQGDGTIWHLGQFDT